MVYFFFPSLEKMVYFLNFLVGNSFSFLSSVKLYFQDLVFNEVSKYGILKEYKHWVLIIMQWKLGWIALEIMKIIHICRRTIFFSFSWRKRTSLRLVAHHKAYCTRILTNQTPTGNWPTHQNQLLVIQGFFTPTG